MTKSKIVLGNKPNTFAPFTVDFMMPDGTTGTITLVTKYRTKNEYGEFLNQIHSDTGTAYDDTEKVDFEKLMNESSESSAKILHEVIVSWDLDIALDLKSLAQLNDELPATSPAIMVAYANACTQGRLGNLKL